jgi:hypothetical protein
MRDEERQRQTVWGPHSRGDRAGSERILRVSQAASERGFDLRDEEAKKAKNIRKGKHGWLLSFN